MISTLAALAALHLDLGVGHVFAYRDASLFGGPKLRAGTTVAGVFVALDASATFGFVVEGRKEMADAQSGGLSLGVPVPVGDWLFRPTVSVGGLRSAGYGRSVSFAVRQSLTGSAGAEVLWPNRAVGLAVDLGVATPLWARYRCCGADRAWGMKPNGHVGATLTWYVR